MTALIIIIILIFGWPYIWRWLRPYFYRWMQRRTEDYVRRAMGMPPRDKSGNRQGRTGNVYGGHERADARRRGSHSREADPVIPKEYAEDVEFTEVRSFSEEEKIGGDTTVRFTQESQVSDAEIIEIKKDR